MPRPPRFLLSKSYYHIMTRGNNKNVVFRYPPDYHYYLSCLARFKTELPFDLYHYCLMPNHVHMLIQTQDADQFATFMKKINLAYFYYYKRKYKWVGHFWQGRYKSQPVGKDEYFIECGKYIELNPVRADLVEKPENYPFSSYRYYVLGQSNDLITEDIFYGGFGQDKQARQESYRKLIIDEVVEGSYNRENWGSLEERRNESRKKIYHLKKKFL